MIVRLYTSCLPRTLLRLNPRDHPSRTSTTLVTLYAIWARSQGQVIPTLKYYLGDKPRTSHPNWLRSYFFIFCSYIRSFRRFFLFLTHAFVYSFVHSFILTSKRLVTLYAIWPEAWDESSHLWDTIWATNPGLVIQTDHHHISVSFVHAFSHSFVLSFLHSLMFSFIHSFVHSFFHPFIPSFLQSFFHLFILSSVLTFFSYILLFFLSFDPSFLRFFYFLAVKFIRIFKNLYL